MRSVTAPVATASSPRVDRLVLVVTISLTTGLALWFLRAMRALAHAWGGVLDDAYIHFVYASSLARGHFYEWSPGGGYSTGATSLLWPVLLAPGHWLGLQKERMALWAALVGAACLGTCIWLGYRVVAEELGSRGFGALAAALIATSGAFLWGSFGGMEVALVAALALALVRALQREHLTQAQVLAALLPLARPEWVFAPLALLVLRTARQPGLWRRARGVASLLAPLLPFAGYLATNLILTGHAASNGAMAKALTTDPNASLGAALRAYLDQAEGLVEVELAKPRMLPPAALVLATLAMLPRGRVGRLCAGTAWLALLASVSVRDAFRHFNRYQMPALPLLLCAAAVGLAAVAQLAAHRRAQQAVVALGAAALMAGNLRWLPSWREQFSHNVRDIHDQQVAMGAWMRAHLAPGTRVALHDAGAVPLLSGLPVLDLAGLGSGDPWPMAWREQQGALFEALERLPPGERPQYFCMYPSWVGLWDLYGETVQRVTLDDNRTAGMPEMDLVRLDPKVLGSGAQPRLPHQGTIVDEVDVADLASERAHHYLIDRPAPTIYRREPYLNQASLLVADGGRVMHRAERMRLRVRPGAPARLVMRTDAWFAVELEVLVDGRPAARLAVPQARKFVEPEVLLPAVALARPEVAVEVRIARGPELGTFHYWLLQ
jgi:hypothetical protein